MEIDPKDIENFVEAINLHSKYNFKNYSVKSFTRRVEKIILDNNLSIYQLILKVKNDTKFLEQIVKDITVNTTELFRDPELWVQIVEKVIPLYASENFINIWHAGCSTGQEMYSMLILLDHLGLLDKVNIYGTDLNSDVLDITQNGKYKYFEIKEYIENYDEVLKQSKIADKVDYSKYMNISKFKNSLKMKQFLINKINLKKHDLVSLESCWNIQFHIILCRNVLIYFNHPLQNKIIRMFYKNLTDRGTLIIGKHEGILGEIENSFDKFKTIYIKKKTNSFI